MTPNTNQHPPQRPTAQAEEDEDIRDEEESRARKRQRNPEGVDRAQEHAGSLERFKRLLVGQMPGGWVWCDVGWDGCIEKEGSTVCDVL